MTQINWNNSRIEEVSEALFHLNPLDHESPESIKNYIIETVQRYKGYKGFYIGTAGWVVEFVNLDYREVKVTLDPDLATDLVLRYIKEQKEVDRPEV